MAISGHNGNNESLIGMSSSIGLSFYETETNDKISITQSVSPIELFIHRDTNLVYPYQYVNISEFEFSSVTQQFLFNTFNLTTQNASVHIELKPLNTKSIGYLIVLKLGYLPVVNSTYADYTFFELFCPGMKKKLC